uniref:Protein FAM91A1-like n=1 Tax=Saccoglossus kowalevskii TaxID=10224 RepID=A0ABM0M4Z0_SACKO|nr:PREDICTED: protein FAM91A1-like [Saccoglossus kowalevskii]
MNADVEFHIRHNYPWTKLPANIKQLLGNSQKEYEKSVYNFSVKNQLRFKGNLIRQVKKDEKKYYEGLLKYSQDHLMLYPYHLSDIMVKGLRVTPFSYYSGMMHDIMSNERSYDSLPNFTAADCLRLLCIGRNQYIDIMNQCRSSKKFFRRKPIRDLLPLKPVEEINIESWWIVQAGYITEDDIKMCSIAEKNAIDKIIDSGPQLAGDMDYTTVHKLYTKGLIYLEVPMADDACIIVPPLEGFVMNRVTGDYFETLLYKIFVSIDEHTNIAELANVLQIDLQLVKNAVSVYCRLGFAKKKGNDVDPDNLHPSWKEKQMSVRKPSQEEQMLIDWTTTINERVSSTSDPSEGTPETASVDEAVLGLECLNSHLVTLSGYTLWHNKDITLDPELHNGGMSIDLLRCESLLGLDPATCSRVLNKNYLQVIDYKPAYMECLTGRQVIDYKPAYGAYWRSQVIDYKPAYGVFTRNNMETHPAIRSLAKRFDLKHTCGYVTMLKSCKPDYANIQAQQVVDELQDATIDLADGDANTHKQSPPSNLTDVTTAMKEKLTLDVQRDSSAVTVDSVDDWVPLDLYFGIPLFDDVVNKDVCQKIVDHKLCDKESLAHLLHSSRKLSLHLLNFINEQQDTPVVRDNSTDPTLGHPPGMNHTVESCIPLPTRNLLFYNGKLMVWNTC